MGAMLFSKYETQVEEYLKNNYLIQDIDGTYKKDVFSEYKIKDYSRKIMIESDEPHVVSETFIDYIFNSYGLTSVFAVICTLSDDNQHYFISHFDSNQFDQYINWILNTKIKSHNGSISDFDDRMGIYTVDDVYYLKRSFLEDLIKDDELSKKMLAISADTFEKIADIVYYHQPYGQRQFEYKTLKWFNLLNKERNSLYEDRQKDILFCFVYEHMNDVQFNTVLDKERVHWFYYFYYYLDWKDTKIYFDVPYNEKELIKQLGGMWDPNEKLWYIKMKGRWDTADNKWVFLNFDFKGYEKWPVLKVDCM